MKNNSLKQTALYKEKIRFENPKRLKLNIIIKNSYKLHENSTSTFLNEINAT